MTGPQQGHEEGLESFFTLAFGGKARHMSKEGLVGAVHDSGLLPEFHVVVIVVAVDLG